MKVNGMLIGALATTMLSACSARRTCVEAGDYGKIEYALENVGAKGSNQRLEEVNLEAAPPAGFPFAVTGIKIRENEAQRLPITIEPGETRTFVISYQIGQKGQKIEAGEYLVPLKVKTLNVFTDPGPGAYDAEMKYTVCGARSNHSVERPAAQ